MFSIFCLLAERGNICEGHYKCVMTCSDEMVDIWFYLGLSEKRDTFAC